MQAATAPRSLPTRVLHLCLALVVLHQLIVGSVMQAPRGTLAGDGFWQAHRIVGIAGLFVLFAFWGWTLLRRDEARAGSLFPWFSAAGRHAVWRDAAAMAAGLRAFRLPRGTDHPVASAIHGLGLLTATAMAVSGATYFLKGVAPALVVRAGLNIHAATANLMWAYLVGHAGLAVLHEMLGDRVLRRMSPIAGRGG